MSEEGEVQVDEAVIQEASDQGWVPQDKYKGNPDHWVDAETFVKKGREIMPILRKNNETLLKELRSTKEQLNSFKQTADEFKKFQTEAHAKKVSDLEAQLANLKVAKREALEQGDHDRVIAIDDAVDIVKDRQREAKEAAKAPPPPPVQQGVDPTLQAWLDRNEWFGQDVKKTQRVNALGAALKQANPNLQGPAFLEALDAEIEEVLGSQSRQRPVSPVEGGNRPGGVGNSKHSYANLPADAKAACDRFVSQKLMTKEEYLNTYDWS
jgi:hypothetical protein